MTQQTNTQAVPVFSPVDANALAYALNIINQMNARLVRIETRQARQMLDEGMTLNKDDKHGYTTAA